MLSQLLQPEIKLLIEERKLGILKEVLSDWSPTDIAELISDLSENDQAILFRMLPNELATDTFEYLEFEHQASLIKAMGKEEVVSILNEMAPDDRTALLEDLPSSVARQMIAWLSPEERKIAQTLLGYPEDSIGRLMTPDYVVVKPEWTISQALDYIRENGKNSETLNIVYVINDKGQLIDDVKIREFLLASLDKKVSDLMDKNFVSLKVTDDQETAVELFKKYDRIALPVTDATGAVIGIVTVDDVFDIAEEEATEDIHKLGAVEALDESYSTISVAGMLKKRAGWLALLLVGEMFTTSAMGMFEDVISSTFVLTLFIPLIISSGGNSGSQAATLVIRALSLGEITLRDWFFVMRREIISGLALGIILAVISFLRIMIWQMTSNAYGDSWILIAATVGFALIGVVLWGTLSGSMLPFILKKLGADPATSSAPLVATLVDVVGVVIYFSLAMVILHGVVK